MSETPSAEVFPARQLDEMGRCCGRKPLFYKRSTRGWSRNHDPHHCCLRCSAEFTPDGNQRANWAWIAVEGGFTPKYPESEAVEYARRQGGTSPRNREDEETLR